MDDQFFKIQNRLSLAKGRILLSEPFLEDFYFKQAVILIVSHSEEGAVGFVLNHPVAVPFQELMPDFPPISAKLSLGGPVSPDALQFIHARRDLFPDSEEVMPGLYWGGDFALLQGFFQDGMLQSDEVFFFLGYAGWSPGQLESELKENSWKITELSAAEVFQVKSESWVDLMEKQGPKYRLWANFPVNPELN